MATITEAPRGASAGRGAADAVLMALSSVPGNDRCADCLTRGELCHASSSFLLCIAVVVSLCGYLALLVSPCSFFLHHVYLPTHLWRAGLIRSLHKRLVTSCLDLLEV